MIPSTASFEPTNIMRYIIVMPLPDGKYNIRVDWSQVMRLAKNSALPINETVFEKVSLEALEKHLCSKLAVNKKNPGNGPKILPWLAANIIFEAAKIIIITDMQPDDDTEKSSGYASTTEDMVEQENVDG